MVIKDKFIVIVGCVNGREICWKFCYGEYFSKCVDWSKVIFCFINVVWYKRYI